MSRRVNASLTTEEIAALETHPEYRGSLGGLLRVLALRQLGFEPDPYADHRARPRDQKGRIMSLKFTTEIEKDGDGKDIKVLANGEWVGWLRVEYDSNLAIYRPAAYGDGEVSEIQRRMGRGQDAASPSVYLEKVAVSMAKDLCDFRLHPCGKVDWKQKSKVEALNL